MLCGGGLTLLAVTFGINRSLTTELLPAQPAPHHPEQRLPLLHLAIVTMSNQKAPEARFSECRPVSFRSFELSVHCRRRLSAAAVCLENQLARVPSLGRLASTEARPFAAQIALFPKL